MCLAGQSAEMTQDICILSQDVSVPTQELLLSLCLSEQVRGLVSGQRSAPWKHSHGEEVPPAADRNVSAVENALSSRQRLWRSANGRIRAQLQPAPLSPGLRAGVWCKNVWAESESHLRVVPWRLQDFVSLSYQSFKDVFRTEIN